MALARSVDELARQVVALRGDLRRRTRRLWWWMLGAIVIGAAGLTFVIVRLAITVGDLQDQQHASCVAFASVGRPELLRPDASQLAREVVQTHAQAARVLGCATDGR